MELIWSTLRFRILYKIRCKKNRKAVVANLMKRLLHPSIVSLVELDRKPFLVAE